MHRASTRRPSSPGTGLFRLGRAVAGKDGITEIDKEERIGKYTLAGLEEEEQSLDRLRRWYRDLRIRDLLGTPPSADADQHLKHCTERLDQYAERVYAYLASPPTDH